MLEVTPEKVGKKFLPGKAELDGGQKKKYTAIMNTGGLEK